MKVIIEENTTAIIKKQRFFLMAVILFIPFTHIPISLLLSGDVLSVLFLFIGYAFWSYELFIQDTTVDFAEKLCFVFLAVSIIWAMITGIFGVWNFPYYSWVSWDQMGNFQYFYDNISKIVPLNELTAMKSWLSYKVFKGSIINVLHAYLISVWIYHLYWNNWEQAFSDLRKVLLFLCSCLVIYSVFEVDYLIGGTLGKSVLETINPLYMKIADVHGWWPPLLWHGQLRSLFAEPSFLGIFFAMAIPVFFSYFYDRHATGKSYFAMVVYFLLIIMLVLSQARTGNVLVIGEIVLLGFWQLGLYRKQWKSFCAIILCTCFAFLIGLGVLSHFYETQYLGNQDQSIEGYLQQNVSSVVGNKRSNSARSANVRATTQIGLQHPLLGIGDGFKSMYLDKNLSLEEKNIPEVRNNWSKYMYEKGPLKSGYPGLNQLAEIFSEQGILGVFLFLLPIGVIVRGLGRKRKLLYQNNIACMGIALCGLCVAFFSNVATIAYYLVIGYMLVIVFSDHDGRQNDE